MKAIVNGALVTPDAVLLGKTLLFDERIEAIADARDPLPAGVETVDARGGCVLPGFVDLHVHGGGGYDFLDPDPGAIDAILRLHASHGTTSLFATTLTCPDEILYGGVERLAAAIGRGRPENGSDLLGIHLEGPWLSPSNVGAQAVKGERTPTKRELDRLFALSGGRISRIDAAPELSAGIDLLAAFAKERGILLSIAHSAANAETALAAYEKGFTHITHLYCSTTTEHKEGQTVHAGIVEAAYLEDGITVELIGDGKHIPRETMLLCFKIKGADKVALVTDAMRAAGTDASTSILGEKKTGTPVVVEDGVAKLPDRSSFAGSVATMDVCFKTALRYGVPLCDAARSCTLTPARIAGVADRKGSLEVGRDADILLFDGNFGLQDVFIGGDRIR